MTNLEVVLPRLGPAETLAVRVGTAALPSPRPGRLAVRLDTTGVSFAEVQMLSGRYPGQPAAPFVPGYDLVETVLAVGAGVDHVRVGDRIATMTLVGAWASVVDVDAATAVPVPARVSSGDVWGRAELQSRRAFASQFRRDLAGVLEQVAVGKLAPQIAATFPLAAAAAAIALHETGSTSGKVLLAA